MNSTSVLLADSPLCHQYPVGTELMVVEEMKSTGKYFSFTTIHYNPSSSLLAIQKEFTLIQLLVCANFITSLSYLFFTTSPYGRYCYPQFIHEDTEGQGNYIMCPRAS